MHTYLPTYMVTCGYLPCTYRWLCLLFMSHFCQPFHDFKVFYNCPLRSRLGFGPTNILLHWYLQYFLYLTTRSCFNCRSSFFSLVRARSSVHDCSQTNPQTYDISLGPRPPPGFSLTCKDCGKAFSKLCHQQSMRCVPVSTKPGFSWRLLFSQTHVCWTMVNHYQPLRPMVNHYQPLVSASKRYS